MKTYTEAQVIAALDAVVGQGTTPRNLANRFQAMLDSAAPALLEDLANAFADVARRHPGAAGECVRSLANETLAESYKPERQQGVEL